MKTITPTKVEADRLKVVVQENKPSYQVDTVSVFLSEISFLYSMVYQELEELEMLSIAPTFLENKGDLVEQIRSSIARKRYTNAFDHLMITKNKVPLEGAVSSRVEHDKDKVETLGLGAMLVKTSGEFNLISSDALHVSSINYNSPMELILGGSMVALVLTVVIAGGEVDTKLFRAKTPGLAKAIANTYKAIKLSPKEELELYEELIAKHESKKRRDEEDI